MTGTGLIALLVLAGLAIDIGYARQRDRNAQNSADAATLSAALEMQSAASVGCTGAISEGSGPCATADPRTVARSYLIRNGWDHDGSGTISGDEAQIHWPPISGEYAGDPSCLEVVTTQTEDTFFAQVFGTDDVTVKASAVACGSVSGSASLPAVLAFGQCGLETINWSGNDNDVIGGMHSNDDVKLEGSGNDYTGGSVIGDNLGYIHTNPSPKSWPGSDSLLGGNNYPPDYSQAPAEQNDPLNGVIDINDFSSGGAWSSFDNYHDLSATGDLDMGVLEGQGYYDSSTKELAAGIYFTDSGKIVINDQIQSISAGVDSDTVRGVTFVTTTDVIEWSADQGSTAPADPNAIHGYAALTGVPGQLADPPTTDPGLVAFTTYDSDASPCGANAELTYQGSYFNLEGVIYAPYGEVRHSGNNNIHQPGAILAEQVAWSGNENLVDSSNTPTATADPDAELKN
ncbi:MAG: hypothetical protein GY708_23130 [Actinomycetia bacterium]|nr:hypothetical protein [Actinomycetes bacterium]